MSRIKLLYDPKTTVSENYCIIETQGSIQTDSELLKGIKIGTFEQDPNGSATLHVGTHRLLGKLVSLKKPIAMMIKQRPEKDLEEDIEETPNNKQQPDII
ncbi:hypothetical protein BB559_006753 [Furculomyces boomerangus]|uniref:Chromosome transmission fidelity protein 8 n=1 Tax=Furculomyces boomerangus TaxID=61424 RepID=A0A2T9Y0S2_9FUNG|nr:hypothetical protein BB559_006795 [Furculomyces boomerangus]PVU85949.1 hypothetical protein BB559_006753 [Furculomyces boomerangus]